MRIKINFDGVKGRIDFHSINSPQLDFDPTIIYKMLKNHKKEFKTERYFNSTNCYIKDFSYHESWVEVINENN